MKQYFILLLTIFNTVFTFPQELSLIKNAALNILVNDTGIANRELNKIISNYELKIEKTDINNSNVTQVRINRYITKSKISLHEKRTKGL